MRRLLKSEIESMIDLYLSGKEKNTVELDKMFKVAKGSCYGLLKRRNLLKYTYSDVVLKLDQNYFNNIDTQEKAYFLGLIAADGCVSKKTNAISIAMVYEDSKNILDFFLKELKSNLKTHIRVDKRTDCKRKTQCTLVVHSKVLKNALISHGILPNKTTSLTFPKINKEFNKDFIRGFIDGDGSFFYKRGVLCTSIVGTYKFLESMQDILCEEINCSKTKLIKHQTGVYYLRFGCKNTIKLRNLIYTNIEPSMERKRFMKNIKEKL